MRAARILVSIIAMVFTVWCATPVSAATEAEDPSAKSNTREMFDTVVDKLDQGGDALVYFNIEGLISDFVNSLMAAIPEVPQQEGAPDIHKICERTDDFLGNIGVYDLQAYGFSSIPVGGSSKYHVQKSYLKIEEKKPTPLLWRIVGKPAPIEGLNYMPKETVAMWGGRVRSSMILELINKAALEVGGEETKKVLDQQFETIKKSMGLDVVSVFNTLQDEIVFGVQLSETEQVNITKDPKNPVKIGKPSFLLVAKTGQEGLMDQLLELQQKETVEFEKMEMDGKSDGLMLPAFKAAPFPLRICFHQGEEYFLMATNKELLREALRVAETGEGVVGSGEFQGLMEDMPKPYSAVSYISQRYMGTVLDMQMQMSEMTPGADVQKVMDNLYGKFAEGDILSVEIARPDGFYSVTKAPYGGKQALKSVMMMPVGMMAGIAAPSFMQARQSSQENAMINNLRQIDAAKEQWAMEHNKREGDEVTAQDIGDYLKGGQLPPLPHGGRYEINPIGEDPVIILPNGVTVELDGAMRR